ncbi:hypothetical protein JOL79_11655 [Microbispora sp. RL4-1S]|uniref:Uncharacterized protein n=1 Tax=Microbispora oryzae TaxID=2806554 RepID=A0A941AHU2_9ACTN|nr:hypothetical protein [Microbispora oryzae]MBP2704470.1 hypothetical protein [Microbispora oryzae]
MTAPASLAVMVGQLDTLEGELLLAGEILLRGLVPSPDLLAEERRLLQLVCDLKDEADMCLAPRCRAIGGCFEHARLTGLRRADHAQVWDAAARGWAAEVLVLDGARPCPVCRCSVVMVQPMEADQPARRINRPGETWVRLVPRTASSTPAAGESPGCPADAAAPDTAAEVPSR